MRSFSKKLAFILAAAMVVTAFAPAAKAEAASEMAINKSSKILYVTDGKGMNDAAQVGGGKGNVSTYDFSVKNKPEDWKTAYSFKWTTDDEDVVSVAKGGVVTAVGVGEATVYCKVTEKATNEVTTLKTNVTVKANAAKVALKNPEVDGTTVAVNGTVDLNRVMFDAAGNKTTKRGEFVTDYTRWIAEYDGAKAEGVEITQKNGVFTFTEDAKAGDYTLYCETYQSKKYTGTTATSDKVVVTLVKENTFEIVQKDLDTFEIVFDNNVTVADVSVDLIMNIMGEDYPLPVAIANPTVKDNKVTVDFFTAVNDKEKYVFTVNGVETEVVASNGDATSFKVSADATKGADYALVTAGATGVKLAVTLYDAKGVDVTKKYENTDAYCEFVEVAPSEEGKYYVSADGEIWFEEANKSLLVDVTFHTNKYAEDSDQELGVLSERFAFISTAAQVINLEGVQAATIMNEKGEDTKKLELPLGTSGSYLAVKPVITGKKAEDVNVLVNGGTVNVNGTDYTITVDGMNDDVFGIFGENMEIVPFNVGTGKVVIYAAAPEKNPVAIGMVTIKVTEAVKLDKVYLEKSSVTVGMVDGLDEETVAIKAKDNYGNDSAEAYTVEVVMPTTAEKKNIPATAVEAVDGKIVVDGSEFANAFINADGSESKATSMTFEYKVKLNGKENKLTVIVKKVNTNAKATYAIDKVAGDWGDVTRLESEKAEVAGAKSITLQMFELNNTVKVGGVEVLPYESDKANAEAGKFYVKVMKGTEDISKKSDLVVFDTTTVATGSAVTTGSTVTIKFSSIDDKGFVSYDVTGAGNYTVTLYEAYQAGKSVAYRTLKTVTGTTTVDQGKYTYVGYAEGEGADVAQGTDKDALRACFKINNREGKEATATVASVNAKVAGDVAFVYDITFTESVGDALVAYKVNVNKTVKIAQ